MSNCCNEETPVHNSKKKMFPRKFSCPKNNKNYVAVAKKTIIHHINSPWESELKEEQYYFCDDPECDVVYFGINGSVISKSELRTTVGVKEKDKNELICYCFGVSKAMAAGNAEIKKYVSRKTKENLCACEIRNPSGRCCLKDFH